MANTISAIKRTRQEQRRTEVNQMRKSRLRHQVRTFRRLLEQKDAKGAATEIPKDFLHDRSRREVGHHQEEHGCPL